MNKIEQMNCHVLFKQVHTMLCICTWKTMRIQIWWMDEFGILRPFQQYYRDDGRANMKGSVQWSAIYLREESLLKRDSNPRPVVGTARKPNLRPTTLPLFSNLTCGSYGNRQNVPRIKTEQYSKYIFNINPLAFFFFMKLKKKRTSLTRFDPGTSRLLDMYFTTALFCKLKYSEEIKIYNKSILIQGKTTHFINKNSGVLKL